MQYNTSRTTTTTRPLLQLPVQLDYYYNNYNTTHPGSTRSLQQLLTTRCSLKQVRVTDIISHHSRPASATSIGQGTAAVASCLGTHWHCQLLHTTGYYYNHYYYNYYYYNYYYYNYNYNSTILL